MNNNINLDRDCQLLLCFRFRWEAFYFEVKSAVGGLHARRQGGVCFGGEDSPGKMAAVGSAEGPGRPASAAASRSRSGLGIEAGSSSLEDKTKKCAACAEAQSGISPHGGPPACPLCLARRHPSSEERHRRRSDPEGSSSRPGRRDCDSQRGRFVYRVSARLPAVL